jgi:sporulation protein YlmC with PRC-barrel domain
MIAGDDYAGKTGLLEQGGEMLRHARDVIGWTVSARGGPAGVVRDVLVHDRRWNVRHLVVETAPPARVRHALISPNVVRRLNDDRRRVELAVEQWEVSAAPDIEYDPPIAVLQEHMRYDTLGWRYYVRKPQAAPVWPAQEEPDPLPPRTRAQTTGDSHLRSVAVMSGYSVQGNDGKVGVLRDFVLDDQTWQISCLVVEAPEGDVAVSVDHIRTIDWERSEIQLDVTHDRLALHEPHDASSPRCEVSTLSDTTAAEAAR